ncbi:MAG TPA: hypothetical protein VF141_00375 [Chryseolinea sp.]
MSFAFKKYKRIFRRNLQPLFAVLAARRRSMDNVTWTRLVDETLRHVMANPVEYLGRDLPHQQLIRDVLDEIRLEFIKESNTMLSVPQH